MAEPHLYDKDELIIIEVREGDGETKGMLDSFLVWGEDRENFFVDQGPLLTKQNRIDLWKMRKDLPGRILIVSAHPEMDLF